MKIDFAKYNPMNGQAVEEPADSQPGGNLAPALSSWRDSATVVCLSEYLKEHKDKGIKLCQTKDGRPSLCFSPGLGKKDINTERWQIAEQSLELLETALPDLMQLLEGGLLSLPTSSVPREIGAGPSQAPKKLRVIEPQNLSAFEKK